MLREDIDDFIKTIPKDVHIVAATKYVQAQDMLTLLDHNINIFGENRVDSFLSKYEELKDYPIHWHFIGHLQRNKAKLVVPKLECLHSLDSIELAKLIDQIRQTPLDCFIEVSINLEENKNGVSYKEINTFIQEVLQYKNVHIIGFMMMAKAHSTPDELKQQFKALAYLQNRINHDFGLNLNSLSMGMSDDYRQAIEAGSTHVRLGRVLWKI